MYNMLCIIFGKILIFIGKLLKRGSSFPGDMVLRRNKKIFKFLKLPDTVIAVTGSSGKGSCTKVLAKMFRDNGYSVTHNSSGANQSNGVLTTLMSRCTLSGKIKDDVVILEMDERYAKFVFPDLKPNIVVVTNITRDQPPRQGHFDIVYNDIKKALSKDIKLVLNADDPYTRKFSVEVDNDITYFGIKNNPLNDKSSLFDNLNINYCPVCNSKLEYNSYHIEYLGDYYCPNCDYKRPDAKYEITNIDYDNRKIEINNKYKMTVPYTTMFSIYNILTCFSVANMCKLDNNKVIETVSNLEPDEKIFKTFKYKDRLTTIINNKNENSSTFNQSIWYVNKHKEKKSIIIGWMEISRKYNFDDLSWLYDISFELINNKSLDKIVCTGIHAYDIAVRLKLAGIKKDQIIIKPDLKEATNYLKNKTKGNIYAILNFDYVRPFDNYMNGSDE